MAFSYFSQVACRSYDKYFMFTYSTHANDVAMLPCDCCGRSPCHAPFPPPMLSPDLRPSSHSAMLILSFLLRAAGNRGGVSGDIGCGSTGVSFCGLA